MIEESAIVISADAGDITFEIQKTTSCGSCSVNKACGTGIISNYLKPQTIQYTIKNTIQAKVGDSIVVGINEKAFLFGSFLMYILPLFFILSFAVLGDYIATKAALINSDIFVIVMSGTGFIFSFVFMKYLLKNKLNLVRFNPELIRKI